MIISPQRFGAAAGNDTAQPGSHER
jgi:hypothetical protein